MKPLKPFATFAVFALCVCAAVAQQPTATEQYEVKEAYEVYSALLPHDSQYRLAKRTVVIQQETISTAADFSRAPCLSAEAAEEFKDAIADYGRVNKKRWLLQRQIELDKPYELVSSEAIQALFEARGKGGDDFEKRYPDSGRYVFDVSAVGFDKDKTQAIVYSGSYCGGLCGYWKFHLMQKVEGKWKEVPGVVCFTVS